MTPRVPLFLPILLAACAASAQSTECPATLKWRDATYAERSTHFAGTSGKADTESFLNATVSHLTVDGKAGAVIMLTAASYGQGINFTSGAGQPKPFEFAEIGMILEPPMADGTWPRFAAPCMAGDGLTMHFDETDVSPLMHQHAEPQKLSGTLTRSGRRIEYAMRIESEENSDRGTETWQGILKYERNLKNFSLATDVQGWHVYRANTYLMTLPSGKPISILKVLEQIGSASTAH